MTVNEDAPEVVSPIQREETEQTPEPAYSFWDSVQTVLDFAGMVPGIGIFADVANAGISVVRGNLPAAAARLASAVPVIGQAATATRLGAQAVRVAKKSGSKALRPVGSILQSVVDVMANP